jgi:DtxR family Mn-dependent transcriptional regulator
MMNLLDENLSDSMEMYLVTIANLRKGDAPVPLSQLAGSLEVTSVSVNEMCRKLEDYGFVNYRPYKGAVLTKAGEKLANHTLRRHRLWEVFLVEKLAMDQQEADEAACLLEHATSDEVIDRLDGFLDNPKYNPTGLPIPAADHEVERVSGVPLTEVRVGETVRVIEIKVGQAAGDFLTEIGIMAGSEIEVLATSPSSMLLTVGGQQLSLVSDLATQILINGSNLAKADFIETDQQRNEETMTQTTTVTAQQIPLSQLQKGQNAIVVRIEGKGAVRRRMMDMGIVPGAEIHVIRVAPFGDPTEYSIKGYSLSLRKSEAEDIQIELKD